MTETKIDAIHPGLSARLVQYRRARDFLEGADALRAHDMRGGSSTLQVTDVRDRKFLGNGGGASCGDPLRSYLPRLSSAQSLSDYNTYVMGALYPNYLQKTREDFRGLIFSKAPVLDLPASIAYMLEDCDYRGTPIEEALEAVVNELYAVSRSGWWIDRPATREGMSKLDEEAAGLRPYIVPYASEDIINWEFIRVGSRITLGRVVLREGDGFRDLQLLPADGEYRYAVRVWTKVERGIVGKMIQTASGAGGDTYAPGPIEFPQMNGAPINEIPFYFFSPFGGDPEPSKPLLEDLVQCAWSLYQSSALLEHARFTCGLATALATGFSDDVAFELGGLNVIKNTQVDAKFSWVERKGEDCLPLERAVEQKTRMLIQLGSKALEEAKKDAESAEALRIRSSGDSATCADIAQAVGRIASQALAFCARWSGDGAPAVTIQLTTDYSTVAADPQEISALDKSVTAGHLAQVDFNARLRKVGILDAARDDESIANDLEAEQEARAEKAAAQLDATARLVAAKAGAQGASA